jgi:hypothetical protein
MAAAARQSNQQAWLSGRKLALSGEAELNRRLRELSTLD